MGTLSILTGCTHNRTRWLDEIGSERPRARAYLMADVGEVDDPTGRSLSVWHRTVGEIDQRCEQLAAVIS